MFHLMFSASKRLFLQLSLLAILTSHGLTLFIPDYHYLLANTLSKLVPNVRSPWSELNELKRNNTQLKAQNKQLKTNIKSHRVKTKSFTQKLTRRIARNISVNTASVLTESVPVYGIAAVVGVTAMDINDACDTMNDMNGLLKELGEEEELSTAGEVCAYKQEIPSSQDITNYWTENFDSLKADTQASTIQLKEEAAEANIHLGGFLHHLVEDLKTKKTRFYRWVGDLLYDW